MIIWYGIDMPATGANIRRLRQEHGLSACDIQEAMGFDSPSAVYKWERGLSLQSIEHMMALSKLFDMRMEDILIWSHPPPAEELFARYVDIWDEQLGECTTDSFITGLRMDARFAMVMSQPHSVKSRIMRKISMQSLASEVSRQ